MSSPSDQPRVTAYWYASNRGLPCDLDFLLEFGRQAARRARWLGIPEYRVPEGPFTVHTWPESAWDYVAPRSAAQAAAMTAAGRAARESREPGAGATRVVHCRRERYDVLIDRSTPWGNPYRIGPDGGREAVIAAYERYVVTRPDLLALIPGLRGKVLGCHCAPLACHGDVLARLADNPATAGVMEIYARLPDGPPGETGRDPHCDRCNYGTHMCKGCGEPLPHGTEVCAGCDDAWGGRGPSASYQEWRDEGAYGPDEVIPPWCPLPQGDQALRDCGMSTIQRSVATVSSAS